MKRTLFAAVLAVTSFVLPAQASPTVNALFTAIENSGTNVAVDIPRICKDKTTLGYYEYQRNVIDQLTICLANHKGDEAELFDTLLHESVHIAQTCKGGTLFSPASIVQNANYAELKTVRALYDAKDHVMELEARVIAREADEVYVTRLLKEHCK